MTLPARHGPARADRQNVAATPGRGPENPAVTQMTVALDERVSGLCLPEADAAPAVAPRAPLTLSSLTTLRWTLDQDLAGCRRVGLDGLGLWTGKFQGLAESEVVAKVRAAGVPISSLSWVGGLTAANRGETEQLRFEARELVRLGGELGAGCVCVLTGGRAMHGRNHLLRRVLPDALRELSDLADECGTRLAVQPVADARRRRHSAVHGLWDTLELLRRVDRENVGLTLHSDLIAADPSLVAELPAAASRVELVKLSDRRARRMRAATPRQLGDGSLPLAGFVSALRAGGYGGPFELDVWDEALGGDADYEPHLAVSRRRFDEYLAAADEQFA